MMTNVNLINNILFCEARPDLSGSRCETRRERWAERGAQIILVLVILPVFAKLMRNTDIFQESMIWIWYAPFGMLFLYLFSMWVYKGYKKATNSAEEILKDLEIS